MNFYQSYDDYRGRNPEECFHRFTVIMGKRLVCLDCGEEIDEIDPDEIKVSFRDLYK